MQEKSFERNSRLEGEIRSVMSELLRFEVNDPRLTDVTVSLIRLSADRSKARVYFSVIGDEEREREAGDGFSAAAPFLRRQLGQKMRLRVVPSLEFLRDTSFEYGDRMERLFDRLSENGMLPSDEGSSNDSKEDS
ncbi:MAG: 30S ribosome-binding factor RbfA [Acidobacteria bacterium]|nr:30S ribosome-binding factor RbfA [Candidatus Sulfomarinibacter sp. MAG AM1]